MCRRRRAQEQLGHASIQTTRNVYTHVVDASGRAAIEQLERQLFATVPKSQEDDSPDESHKHRTNSRPRPQAFDSAQASRSEG
jgi:hypothetical protein